MNLKDDAQLDEVLEKYGCFEVSDQGKLRCKLTNHELSYRLDEVEKYVKTPKFLRSYELDKVLNEYGDYFEDVGRGLFGCKLTMRTVARDGKTLRNHVNGGKFKRALAIYRAKKEQEQTLNAAVEMEVESEIVQENDQEENIPIIKAGKKRPKTSGVRRNALKKSKA